MPFKRRNKKEEEYLSNEETESTSPKPSPSSPSITHLTSSNNSTTPTFQRHQQQQIATDAPDKKEKEFNKRLRLAGVIVVSLLGIYFGIIVVATIVSSVRQIIVQGWDAHTVAEWMKDAGLGAYAYKFHVNEVTGEQLLQLTRDDILHIAPHITVGSQIKLQQHIKRLSGPHVLPKMSSESILGFLIIIVSILTLTQVILFYLFLRVATNLKTSFKKSISLRKLLGFGSSKNNTSKDE
eukprot:gb/GECH01004084.1/.p1 GENE.gb/GECH01004084.1/~~gb/GECH01004084.1/.p1  ORF type:complete len:238 (+),score=48.02 gb/GECH01004084.1/:1-714(+)